MALNKLRLETTAPFQGLAELVAYDEGLFAKEGIEIEWMDREKGVDKSPQMHITNHKDTSRFLSHGKMMEQGKADLYNACEWGNYCRVPDTRSGGRQVGRSRGQGRVSCAGSSNGEGPSSSRSSFIFAYARLR